MPEPQQLQPAFSWQRHFIVPILIGVSGAVFLGLGNWVINTDRFLYKVEHRVDNMVDRILDVKERCAKKETCEKLQSEINFNEHEIDEHEQRIQTLEKS